MCGLGNAYFQNKEKDRRKQKLSGKDFRGVNCWVRQILVNKVLKKNMLCDQNNPKTLTNPYLFSE